MNAIRHWKKVAAQRACEVIDADELDGVSKELLSPEISPEEYIHELCEALQWSDAIKMMARVLPAREAVWWACVCTRQMETLPNQEDEMAALVAAEQWVFKPNDENRRAAFLTAQENTSASAGTLVALCVGFSGGNMPATEGKYLKVSSSAFSQVVHAAVMVSAGEKTGEQLRERFALFIRSGEHIARGGNGIIQNHDS